MTAARLVLISLGLALVAAGPSVAAGLGPASATGAPVVRPGMAWTYAEGRGPSAFCTLAFLFQAGGDTYASTAGHCLGASGDALLGGGEVVFAEDERPVVHLGAPVRDADRGPRIGVGVYAGLRFPEDGVTQLMPDLPPYMDLGLILLDEDVAYDPAMCFYGGPTGLNQEVTPVPTLAHLYGSGNAFGYEHFTQTTVLPGRSAAVTLAEPEVVRHALPVFSGDSGSPIIDSDGGAVATTTGPTFAPRLAPALERVHEVLGLRLDLLTAPQTSSPAAGSDPACAPWAHDEDS